MKLLRKISKKYYFRQITAYLFVCCIFFSALLSTASAGPQGADVIHGEVLFQQSGNNTVIIVSDKSIINYSSFDIGTAESVQFVQPHSNASVLNRILSANPTSINGTLLANGRVFFVNPAGVIIGAGARINVSQLVASGLNMSNSDFINGRYEFANGSGIVANHADISAESVYLVGKKVINTGTITCPEGYVVIANGRKTFLVRPGSNVVVEVDGVDVSGITGVQVPDISEAADDTTGESIVLAAGDIFSLAIADIDSLPGLVAVGKSHGKAREHDWQGDDFNPGGGPDKLGEDGIGEKGWGTGNKGNGVGNIWVGNQGKGRGGGMAGGDKPGPPDEPPGPPDDPPGPPDDPPDEPPDNGDDGRINVSAAPLPQLFAPEVEQRKPEVAGCSALLAWAAEELGIEQSDIQVYLENAFVYKTDIQPCDMCARLKDVAMILADANGVGVAALAQVVNEFASTPAPPSEEQMTLIAASLANHIDDGTYYAAAGQWIDALVEYVGILDSEIGWSADKSVTFVMEKYGSVITEGGDVSVTTYVEMRLGAIGG